MQFGWNLIGFMESLSIVLPQDNGTVEIASQAIIFHRNYCIHCCYMVVRSPRGGVAPDEWRTLPPGGNWDRLGGFLQTINHSNGFKGLVAKFYCYYDASLKPRWDTWWVEIPPGAISSDGSPPPQGRDPHLPPPPPGVIRPSLISHAPNTPIRHPLVTDNFKSATATNATAIAGMKIGHCNLL